jgi:homoserine kinase
MALNLWNEFELHSMPGDGDVCVEASGEGAHSLPTGPTNLIAQTMLDELARLNAADNLQSPVSNLKSPVTSRQSYKIICHNHIPCGSGLGSSSTAVLAGLIFAHGLKLGYVDPKSVLLRATAVEGHGDNVGPALYGGLLLISYDGSTIVSQHVALPPLKVVVCVPDYHFLTSEARAALPTTLSRQDAVFNIGRAMLVAEALRNGDATLLARAMADRIHEPYRLPLIPGALEAKRAALAQGARAVILSGAGPGMLAFAHEGHDCIGQAMQTAFAQAGLKARYWALDVSAHGAEVTIAM